VKDSAAAVFPASFAQERLWFLDRFEPGSPFYNVPAASRLRARMDLPALTASLNEIVRRHESLRTTFAEVDGQPVQVIAPRLTVGLAVLDRRHLPPEEREAEVERLAAEEALVPFDLTAGPLLRCTLVRLAAEDSLLLLTLHHIISDAWSLGILFRELSVLYESQLRRRPSPLPELPIQYADFAQWQREWLQGEVLESYLAFWRRQLAGASTVIELPTDRPRPDVQTFRGALDHFELPAPLAAALAALGQRRGSTLFMILLAAYLILLQRYSGQLDLVVGSPIANRNRAELEGLIGFFANTLVLRVDLSGEPSFAGLLDRVAEVTLAGYDHQDLPFEKLVAELRPERSLSRNPLFQVLFSLQNAPTLAASMASPGSHISEVGTGTAKFDLALLMGDTGGKVVAGIEYNTDLFESTTARRLVGHYLTLLDSAAAEPGRPISALDLLTPAERHEVQASARGERAGFQALPVHRLVEEQIRRTPDAVAVAAPGEAMSYRELGRRAHRLALRLSALGVGRSSRVGLSAGRSPAALVGMLAVLAAGAAYVPLAPDYPAERLAFMLADSRARVLLTERRLLGRFPPGGARVLLLDDLLDGDPFGARHLPDGAGPDDLAYVIYTSGSTGRPKGVAMPHRPLVNLVAWQNRSSRLRPGASTLQFASLCFDVSFQEIFATWTSGGRLVLLPEEGRQDAGRLLRCLVDEGIERLFLPPVALQQLAEAAARSDLRPAALREILAAGEQLQVSPAVRSFLARLGGAVLRNQYGPSETHVVTCFSLAGAAAGWPTLPPIGRPIANVRAHLLDAGLQPVPEGVPGDLYIGSMGDRGGMGGAALARGYFDRPDLTAERFLPDPWGDEPGGRLYRTGDLARALPGGDLQFLGRRDDQVKIRGYRVELAEIEILLEQYPGVRTAVVVAREDPPGPRRLVAYLGSSATPPPAAGPLRAFLKERLPEYMVPAAFLILPALPLLPSGKVNRRALPRPDQDRPAAEPGFLPPRTPLEVELVKIWQNVLKIERVGVHDDFFDLGGHSLLATQVVSRVRDLFGLEVPLRRIFEAPTVAGFAAILVGSRVESRGGDDVAALLAELESLSDDEARALAEGLPS
jgi:amino acid adenylation domain-containing protein